MSAALTNDDVPCVQGHHLLQTHTHDVWLLLVTLGPFRPAAFPQSQPLLQVLAYAGTARDACLLIMEND